jgi:hypothetical protein
MIDNFAKEQFKEYTDDKAETKSAAVEIIENKGDLKTVQETGTPDAAENFVKEERGIMERLRGRANSLGKVFLLLSAFSSLAPAKERPNLNSETKIEASVQEIIFENSAFKLAASPDKKSKNDPEVAKKIGLVHVEAVCDGVLQTVNFTAEDLEKNPSLEVNGFLKGVMVLGDEVETKFNGKKARQLESGTRENGEIKVEMPWLRMNDIVGIEKFSQSLSDSRADSGYILEYLKMEGAGDKDKIPGTAYQGTFEKAETMNPMNYIKDNLVEVSGKKGKYVLPIKQEMEVISKKFSAGHRAVDFLYVGSGLEQFKNDKVMNEKMKNVSYAIGEIEDSLSDKKLVKGFEIINTKEKNAQAEDNGYIRFTTGYLNDEDSAEIVNTTEHEVIHRHFQENELGKNMELRGYFADLRGYQGSLKGEILKEGEMPEMFAGFSGADKNEAFFKFIEESNFFSMEGGHTTADIEEFICSFTHSLIYSDKLEGNLSKMSQTEGQPSVREQQLGILNNYDKTISAMLKASNSKKEKQFLEKKSIEISILKNKFE